VTADGSVERAVLGALLLAAEQGEWDRIEETLAHVRPEDFAHRAHRLVFQAVAAVHRSGRRPTLTATTAALRRRGLLDEVRGQVAGPDGLLTVAEGAVFLCGLVNEIFTVALLSRDAAAVRAAGRRRELARLAAALWDAVQRDRPTPELAGIVQRLARALP
jgi:replicative DNA helicase